MRRVIAVCGLLLLSLACRQVDDRQRLLVVGWDGATWDVIDPLLEEGRLPRLAAIMERGFSARLDSTIVPISSAAWAAAVTGHGPGESGIYSFFESVPGSYDVRLISSRSLRTTPIWRTLSRRGHKSIVFGVPVTYPPEPIEGVMVAGMLAPPDAEYAHPAPLTAELRERGFVPDLGAWHQPRPLEFDDAVIDSHIDLKREVLHELLEQHDWRLAWVVFKSLDVLSHGGGFDPSPNGATAKHLERLDRVLGSLVEHAGSEARVLVLSDHGFQRHSYVFNLHSWLVEEGYAVERPPGPPLDSVGRSIASGGPIRHRRRMDELDLDRTRAFTATSEGNYGGIRLNLAGREPRGIVAPQERTALLREIRQRLETLTTAAGEPLVLDVVEGSELYPGTYAGSLPDLLLTIRGDHLAFTAAAGPVLSVAHRPIADHARAGILVGAGPGIEHQITRLEASILDVAPTAMAMLDLAPYSEQSGRVLVNLGGDSAEVARRPESEDPPDTPAYREFSEREPGWLPAPARSTRERLRALGYVE